MPDQSSLEWITERIISFGEQRCWAQGGREWRYRDFTVEISECRRRLEAAGVQSGDVVAIVGDYSFWSVSMFIALCLGHAIIVPIATRIPEEVDSRLAVIQPDVVIHFRQDGACEVQRCCLRTDAHPLVEGLRSSNHSGLVLFSSGSTGTPKAMIHDLDALWNVHREKRPKGISILVFLMFDHIGGLNTLFNALAVGGFLVVPSSRRPDDVAELIERYQVKVLPTSPTFLNLLLMADAHHRHDLSSLRMITYGTEPMPESLLARLKAAFPKVKLLQTFGTSETGIGNTVSRSSGSLLIRIDDPNLEWKIVGEELWLKSKTQVLGYLNHDMNSFTADGWFRTGDLVEQAGEGYFRIVGRKSEIINVGGEKVFPNEVESVVMEVEGVLDCLVMGEPNAITGQSVTVRLQPGEGEDFAELRHRVRQHCRQRLAAFKVPTRVSRMESACYGERFKKVRLEGGNRNVSEASS